MDVRIIAATNRDLETMVREKRFREDLFYRLSVVPIQIPPLRERRNDILPLAQHFLDYYNQKNGCHKRLSPATCVALVDYDWAGNVRQLKNAIEQAMIMTDGDVIQPENLPVNVARNAVPFQEPQEGMSLSEFLERTELQYLNVYYHKCGSIREAAKRLKMSPTTFLRHRACLTQKYG